MKIAVPTEIAERERRVALVPDAAAKLIEQGAEVIVESGAGAEAAFLDERYEAAGAKIEHDTARLFKSADIILKVQKPVMNEDLGQHEVQLMAEGALLCTMLQPLTSHDLVKSLAESGITSFSMDAIPRIARAQSMDALSSMASLSGYKAVLVAANSMGKILPMMVTAAGTIAPAKGMVLGAGVAGLQAIATARRLGAVMSAYDVRPAVKEQVESLGATFVEAEVGEEAEGAGGYAKELTKESQERERQMIHDHLKGMDFVITTAAIPGRPAPILIQAAMVRDMQPGAVIVDLAAETGGNCELTKPGAEIVEHGVTIIGPLNLPSTMPTHASQMYARNISTLLQLMIKDGEIQLDFEDEIIGGCCITHQGQVVHERTKALMEEARA